MADIIITEGEAKAMSADAPPNRIDNRCATLSKVLEYDDLAVKNYSSYSENLLVAKKDVITYYVEALDFYGGALLFTVELKSSDPSNFPLSNLKLQYATYNTNTNDYNHWQTWNGSAITVSSKYHLLIIGDNTSFSKSTTLYYYFLISSSVRCAGCVNSLLHPTKARSMNDFCFFGLFQNTPITYAPDLPSMSLTLYCYASMFYGCTKLKSTPNLPAIALAYRCYYQMFLGCSALTSIGTLAATTLAEYACYSMFRQCTSLTTAKFFPATTAEENCYDRMYQGCAALTSVPSELPFTTLANNCCENMFISCAALTSAPTLKATTLADSCYKGMFNGCSALTSVPNLPATTLANHCCDAMFYGCTSMTTSPVLPAKTLVSLCYDLMFYGCTKLNKITAYFTTTPSDTYTKQWVLGVASSGDFYSSSSATFTNRGINAIPTGWTLHRDSSWTNPASYDTSVYTEADGSKWIRIFHHNNPAAAVFASTDSFSTKVYKDANRWFDMAVCNKVTSWELMAKLKDTSSSTEVKCRWIQKHNPMTATYAQASSTDNITKVTTSGYTSGYCSGIYYHNSNTYLNGANNKETNWWGAIGSWTTSSGGIPGYVTQTIITTGYLDIYLRVS